MTTTDPSVLSEVRPFELYDVRVLRRERLSPHLVRVTFGEGGLAEGQPWIADAGFDQRIKLIFPAPGRSLDDFPRGDDWFTLWRALPDDERPAIRTYTLRQVRRSLAEFDVDMVDHGDSGPGSRFAGTAAVGDQVLVLGPNDAFDGDAGGVEFHREAATGTHLLVGDETAIPAIWGICERLPQAARGLVCVETADAADVVDLPCPPGVELSWVRSAPDRGGLQTEVVRRWLTAHPELTHGGGSGPDSTSSSSSGETTIFFDGSDDAYWETAVEQDPRFSVWIAGESSVVKSLRRVLVNEFEVPKSAVAFMGYWREGRAEN
ncbi:siderophore-interacting protein [Branchiibius sp. NY16-3462-2]|uniref:siderophore-interacting protein n=1 Tax=Branchiibius sp. NY16-3462-2 TaxID=1807500 RepID=UPI000795EF4B|nr:siderophore-interacting protein [Branchiibius sp. NY16-3462-2]KYH44373.1 hypothetical protein AZH51_07515 [Branchiibius sp. NY16-3462-2]